MIYGWLPSKHNWYDFGYSPLAFIGLYLLGRYMRKYMFMLSQISKSHLLFFFFSMEILVSIFSFIAVGYVDSLSSIPFYLFLYTSPFTIVGGVLLLLFFSKLKFKSAFVNWISSSFAVYLLHAHPIFFKNFYSPFISVSFQEDSQLWFTLKVGLFMLLIYISAILMDKARCYLWCIIARNLAFK